MDSMHGVAAVLLLGAAWILSRLFREFG